ncbi:MAG: DUF6717 family protein [Planctomycetota bacterium]
MNQIFVICPYRQHGTWVFDDPAVDLVAEPFVSGVPEIIDRLVAAIDRADEGFRLLFSAGEMPDAHLTLDHLRPEIGGHWYRAAAWELEGWLCPAMFKYFDDAPDRITLRVEPLDRTPAPSIKGAFVTSEELDAFETAMNAGNRGELQAMLDLIRERVR